jgi:uncharacterized low-complexity protein
MSQKFNRNAFALAIGATALAGSIATANANPFEMNSLNSGYQGVVQGEMGAKGEEGKCGEGKCGAAMEKKGKAEGKCGEGKCGAGKKDGKASEGKCGMEMMDADKNGKVSKAEFMAAHEKMFAKHDANSDGSIDADEMKKAKEGACGGDKKGGEGKCGGDKK